MELTILLAKVFGLYLIISGAVIMVRQRYFIPVVGTFVEERFLRLVLAAGELLVGLFLIIGHNDWTSWPAGIISLFGWWIILESLAYLVLPDALIEKLIRSFNIPSWYTGGGIFAIVIGAYLALFGFGWF